MKHRKALRGLVGNHCKNSWNAEVGSDVMKNRLKSSRTEQPAGGVVQWFERRKHFEVVVARLGILRIGYHSTHKRQEMRAKVRHRPCVALNQFAEPLANRLETVIAGS